MKVTNNKIGPSASTLDNVKSSKTDGSKNLGSAAASALKGKAAENVQVSERAQMMQKAKDIASNQTVDEARVAQLQKLIDEGKYKTDAKAIADRLVDEHMTIPD